MTEIAAMQSLTDQGLRILWFDTAWGRGCLTYSPEPFAVFRIILPGIKDKARPERWEEQKTAHPSAICVGRAVADFFSGRRPAMIPATWLATGSLTPSERAILKVVRRISYGATRTYAEVAAMAGFPNGARFAGNALHKNPFPVIIPCHRVVRADGTIGGFAAGCQMKEKMIALEAATIRNK